MKDEYDFSNAEQGKFYRPLEDLDIPIYLDEDVKAFFLKKLKAKNQAFSLNEEVNAILRKDIEVLMRLSS